MTHDRYLWLIPSIVEIGNLDHWAILPRDFGRGDDLGSVCCRRWLCSVLVWAGSLVCNNGSAVVSILVGASCSFWLRFWGTLHCNDTNGERGHRGGLLIFIAYVGPGFFWGFSGYLAVWSERQACWSLEFINISTIEIENLAV